MKYISDSKLCFLIEYYIEKIVSDLHSAQLQGHFKTESYCIGQLEILKTLSNALNLKISVDKFLS